MKRIRRIWGQLQRKDEIRRIDYVQIKPRQRKAIDKKMSKDGYVKACDRMTYIISSQS